MEQNKSREEVLGRINRALKTVVQSAKPKEGNYNYDDLYVPDVDNNLNLFIDSALKLGVQVLQCSCVEEFKKHFQQVIAENGFRKVNCMDKNFFQFLQLDSFPVDWTDNLMDCEVALTSCEVIIARTGTIVMNSSQVFGRVLPIHTPVHIIIGNDDQIVYDLQSAFKRIELKNRDGYPSALFFSSGVSSTGDIEKTLVRGVHGPEVVYIFLFKN